MRPATCVFCRLLGVWGAEDEAQVDRAALLEDLVRAGLRDRGRGLGDHRDGLLRRERREEELGDEAPAVLQGLAPAIYVRCF